MSYYRARAFNPLTREWREKPQRPSVFDYDHLSEWLPAYYEYVSAMKKWDAFIAELPETYVYKRPKLRHATQEEKGAPVARLRKSGRRKYTNGSGVSANSRVLSHHYAGEGDKGAEHRREIRRKERALWEYDASQEYYAEEDAYDAADWYAGKEADVFLGETVFTFEDESPYDDWCDTCNGPCVL